MTRSIDGERFYFDQERADKACAFFPAFLHFVEGEWAGRPFRLQPWQQHHTRQIFGWRRRKDGTRRYRFVRGWVARKNGKSAWAAGLAHLLTIGDGEPGAQVFTHALDRSQASVVFDMATRMVALSPALQKHYEVTKTSLLCPALMSVLRPLTGEAVGKHGLSPHANIGDEAHVWPNAKLHTFLMQGMGARRQPLDVTISTAGEIKTYGHELYQASKALIEDPSLDPETYSFIYEAHADDDWTDPATWRKANPNLGVSLKEEWLAMQCERAKSSPRWENDFRRYHLNQWVEQNIRWLPMREWAKNTAQPDAQSWKELRELLKGRRCFGGLDLGSTSDITALVWCFPPPDKENGRTILLPRFWCPQDMVEERDSPATPYSRWVATGALETTPGNTTDYDFIERAVMDDAQHFKVEKLAIDRWNATQVAVHLETEGIPVNLFGQGYASMGAPTHELERRFMRGEFEHGNHPVMKWMFGNATIRKDPTGAMKPDKERALEKIDGVVAAVMALGLSLPGVKPPVEPKVLIF